jgi:N-acetylmuramoyl-L-alanine amidase
VTAPLSISGPAFVADSDIVDQIISSPNVNARRNGLRPEILVLHYTGLPTFARSIEVLRDPRCEVSCHYVVDTDGRIVQMVAENLRAWHAGVSFWRGERDINSQSIGIEIQNAGPESGCPEFPDPQMKAVERLAADIISRNAIPARNVVAHSDIAPGRKIDPGERFDWPRLNRAGIGLWVAPEPHAAPAVGWICDEPIIHHTQTLLSAYGYGIKATGVLDDRTAVVVAAFQRHFRPGLVDGRIDHSTLATLEKLCRMASSEGDPILTL